MLKQIYVLSYKMELLTGLHIGGSADTFDIGGADSTVIKNPLTKEPYIPGSSIKGKLRSLLTRKYGTIEGGNIEIEDTEILNLFEPVMDNEGEVQVSRAIFRDASLTKESSKELQDHLGLGTFTEIKAENKINPLSGTAANPRFIERVPAGAVFEGQIVLQVFDKDNEEKLINVLKEAIEMLEINYLGGSGTRGYGRVKINNKEFESMMDNENV